MRGGGQQREPRDPREGRGAAGREMRGGRAEGEEGKRTERDPLRARALVHAGGDAADASLGWVREEETQHLG